MSSLTPLPVLTITQPAQCSIQCASVCQTSFLGMFSFFPIFVSGEVSIEFKRDSSTTTTAADAKKEQQRDEKDGGNGGSLPRKSRLQIIHRKQPSLPGSKAGHLVPCS